MERVLNVCANKWIDEVIIGAPSEVTADLVRTWNIKAGWLLIKGLKGYKRGFKHLSKVLK